MNGNNKSGHQAGHLVLPCTGHVHVKLLEVGRLEMPVWRGNKAPDRQFPCLRSQWRLLFQGRVTPPHPFPVQGGHNVVKIPHGSSGGTVL
jgi:hypothetical protein